MKNIFRHPEQSLAVKLSIVIGLLMVVGSFIFWYALLYKQKKDIMAIAVRYGNSFIDFTKQSTRYSMLTSQKEKTQVAIENLGTPEGVQRVRIFDHKGKIYFSTFKEDIGNFVDKSSIACKGCHLEPERSSKLLQSPEKWNFYKNNEGSTALKIVSEISNEPSCYNASCHMHSKYDKSLGFVEADLSLALLDKALFNQRLALTFYVFIFVVAVLASLGIINYKIVTNPVRELVRGMEKAAGGDLDSSVPIKSTDEIGELAQTFNSMIKDIKAARDQKERWTQTLEEEIAKKTEEIQKTQASLLQTEKLASLGRMAAGVAHEINNPLTGIVTFAHLLKNNVPPDSSEAEDLNVIIEQAERCAKIIKNLLTFAHATPSEKGEININDLLNRTIYMVKNQAKFHNIKFNINMGESPSITPGDATQFQQIFLNMFLNAVDAMNGRGTISVTTRKVIIDNQPFIEIEFTDTGSGIPEDIRGKLFEPFFTTKPVGQGTGLGLAVSHGIVKHYGGHIDVKSVVGKGTSFFVRLPASA